MMDQEKREYKKNREREKEKERERERERERTAMERMAMERKRQEAEHKVTLPHDLSPSLWIKVRGNNSSAGSAATLGRRGPAQDPGRVRAAAAEAEEPQQALQVGSPTR